MHFTPDGICFSISTRFLEPNLSMRLKSTIQEEVIEIPPVGKYQQKVNISLDFKSKSNGTYYLTLNSQKMAMIEETKQKGRIVRAKVGDKLVSVSFCRDIPMLEIADFQYEYDIVIDPGHGGIDLGARNPKMQEKNLNLLISLYEKKRYEEHGLKVAILRKDDSEGLMMGSKKLTKLERRGYALGYLGSVSRYVYSNHHNGSNIQARSGWEIILTNQGGLKEFKPVYEIGKEWETVYPFRKVKRTRIYGMRKIDNSLIPKGNGKAFSADNSLMIINIPYIWFQVYVALYEACYMTNDENFDWYMENWQQLSEIKVKHYVEALGKNYIPKSLDS